MNATIRKKKSNGMYIGTISNSTMGEIFDIKALENNLFIYTNSDKLLVIFEMLTDAKNKKLIINNISDKERQSNNHECLNQLINKTIRNKVTYKWELINLLSELAISICK